MRARTLAALMAVLLLSWPVAAQDQRGTIEGTVKDASGAALPGATRCAKDRYRSRTERDVRCVRWVQVPISFPGRLRSDCDVGELCAAEVFGRHRGPWTIKRLEFALGLAGVAESVSVTAESPIVDVKQSARQTNIRAEQVERLHGRDFTTMVTQALAPTRNCACGLLIDRRERRREPLHHRRHRDDESAEWHLGQENLIADFVDEVQVKSSGYTAEFGGAMGGVINVVTKSGSNDFHGSGGSTSREARCPVEALRQRVKRSTSTPASARSD